MEESYKTAPNLMKVSTKLKGGGAKHLLQAFAPP